MGSQSAMLAGKILLKYKSVGFCYGGLGIAISESSSSFVTFGYLSTTTCGMAFGLLCITIATFVYNKEFIMGFYSASCLVLVWP